MLQGSLGTTTTTQQSRIDRSSFHSFHYKETSTNRNGKRNFEVTFDERNGLVTAVIGKNDRASVPYIQPFRDPLGILHEVRHLDPSVEFAKKPMLGKDVIVQMVGGINLDTVLGERKARVYSLHPGNSHLYIDAEEPYPILKMTQRLTDFLVDILLVNLSHEEGPPAREKPSGRSQRQRSRRRGRGQKRKRRTE
ncbi:MAG: hypothetical protein JSV66_02175 [Trueperaceae bacterium]|nr:MAG: hypothetical protein JSV66_02175 [Trueperaceae bacterium]